MYLRRRKVRVCSACGKRLFRKEKEQLVHFLKRQTCDNVCKEILWKKRKEKAPKCFCGEYVHEGNPYCCWEHRLIAIKCKQWGIESNLECYQRHADMLAKQQLEIDKNCNSERCAWCPEYDFSYE